MKYKELLNVLKELEEKRPEMLEDDISIYSPAEDEFFEVEAIEDSGHLFLIIR